MTIQTYMHTAKRGRCAREYEMMTFRDFIITQMLRYTSSSRDATTGTRAGSPPSCERDTHPCTMHMLDSFPQSVCRQYRKDRASYCASIALIKVYLGTSICSCPCKETEEVLVLCTTSRNDSRPKVTRTSN